MCGGDSDGTQSRLDLRSRKWFGASAVHAMAAMRALDAFYMAKYLSEKRKVSFDTVVRTMYETGRDLNVRYRETASGGLAKNYFYLNRDE